MRTGMYSEEEQRRHSPMDRAIRRTGLVCDSRRDPTATEVNVPQPPRTRLLLYDSPLMRFAPLLALLLLGCGPIRSSVGLIQAERALRDARLAGASERAPYPFTLADELLQKAKEEQGYSAYSDSLQLALESIEQSREAAAIARTVIPPTPPKPPAPPQVEATSAEPTSAPPDPAAAETTTTAPAPSSTPSPWDSPTPSPTPASP